MAGYRLDWRPAGSPYGAGHCVELPLLLGDEQAWRGSPMIGESRWDEVESFGRQLRAGWLRFARTGTVDPALTSGYPVLWATSAEELALLR